MVMVYPNYYYHYNNYYKHKMQNSNLQKLENTKNIKEISKDEAYSTPVEEKRMSPKHNSFANFNLSNLFSSNLEEPILEILGIKLYFDDILIIGLLFFLYSEGVKDDFLFIVLILLLLG